MVSDQLRVIDEAGEIVEVRGCSRCEDVSMDDVENLQAENRRLLRRMSALEAKIEEKRRKDPQRDLILRLIDHWKSATGHHRSNAEAADRFDIVKLRLKEGYTEEELRLAIDGIGAYRYVVDAERRATGTKKQRHDRLGIALGGGEQVEKFANLGAEANAVASRAAEKTETGPDDPTVTGSETAQ